MKIISYNLNGIRSALGKGLADWLKATDADIVCFQELKAEPSQFDTGIFEQLGYKHYWHPAEKKGYSGVAILSKREPDKVEIGCGMDIYDREGRVIRADYGDVSVISVYHPSGSSGDERQAFKMQWLGDFQKYIDDLKKQRPNLIISGDYNICHKPIDIHNPVGNKDSSGFLPKNVSGLEILLTAVLLIRSAIITTNHTNIHGGVSVPTQEPRTLAGALIITW